MTVYAVRDIAGYKKGDEVQVFHAQEIDGGNMVYDMEQEPKNVGLLQT